MIPLWFTSNFYPSTGTYYYRIYALVDGSNIWSGEQSFVVKPIPKTEISFGGIQKDIYKGDTATFTWDITGPASTTTYTTVYIGTESKSESLDSAIDPASTTYGTRLLNDFIYPDHMQYPSVLSEMQEWILLERFIIEHMHL